MHPVDHPLLRSEPRYFDAEVLTDFVRLVFERLNVPSEEAYQAARVLISADLRGIDSHGVARLHSYVGLLESGRINPRPRPSIVRESPACATVDGDNGMGLVIGPHANRIACDKADEFGSGWVTVRNSNHFGIAGYYVRDTISRGKIGLAMTNSTSVVAPLWGMERQLGTNPIAAGFPGQEEPALVIDMATSVVCFGKIERAISDGREIPLGWAIDKQGETTSDPRDVKRGGAILPLGSVREKGGHKGYCLGAAVDLLSAVLSGANWGPFAPSFVASDRTPRRRVGDGIGHFFGALSIEGFADPETFRKEVDAWIRTFHATTPRPGSSGPLVPGDPERIALEINTREGIPLSQSVQESLDEVASRLGVPLGG